MTCCEGQSCEVKPTVSSPGYKLTEILRKSNNLFKPSILSNEIKFKTRFRPNGKILDLAVSHDSSRKQTFWEVCAKGRINDSFSIDTKIFGMDRAHVKLLFNNPSVTDIYAELSGVIDPKSNTVTPRIDVGRRIKNAKILSALTYNPAGCCSSEGCTYMAQSSVEMSGIFNVRDAEAGVQVIIHNPSKPEKIEHLYAMRYHLGLFTATISSDSFKNIKSSLIYRHDSSLKLGLQFTYDKCALPGLCTFGFQKKIGNRTKIIGMVSTDAGASVAIRHALSDVIAFSCSNQFKLNQADKAALLGFGLELNA